MCGFTSPDSDFAINAVDFTDASNIAVEINIWEGATSTTCYSGNAVGGGVD
jgi:hypothetical protein